MKSILNYIKNKIQLNATNSPVPMPPNGLDSETGIYSVFLVGLIGISEQRKSILENWPHHHTKVSAVHRKVLSGSLDRSSHGQVKRFVNKSLTMFDGAKSKSNFSFTARCLSTKLTTSSWMILVVDVVADPLEGNTKLFVWLRMTYGFTNAIPSIPVSSGA